MLLENNTTSDSYTNELVNSLRKIAMFTHTNPESLREIVKNANKLTYNKNTVVVTEGDKANSLFLVLEGKVKVYLSDERGKEVLINILGAGDYFGELSLIDEEPRSATVKTIEKCTFLIVSKIAFEKLIDKLPNLTSNILLAMCKRIRSLTHNVKSLALLDVYGRIVETLYELGKVENGQLIIENRLTQQELAERVGSSREMVSRILRELLIGGYIVYDKKTLIILKKLPNQY